MMVTSMTGYGSARVQAGFFEWEISIKSVNGRYLETRFFMPKEYASFELDLKKKINEKVVRGSLDIWITKKTKGSYSTLMSVNEEFVRHYIHLSRSLSKKYKLVNADLTVKDILSRPEAFSVKSKDFDEKSEKKMIFKALSLALKDLFSMRQKEGQVLGEELSHFLASLKKAHGELSRLSLGFRDIFRARWEEKLSGLPSSIVLDAGRVSQEVLFLVEKADIREELVRLGDHIHNCQLLLKKKEAKGKKLDFYSQELLREINTIGSKSGLAEVTRIVIEAKATLESFREQVQNVE